MVIRFTKNGDTANARPCANCLKMMKDVGVNKVYYSTGTEEKMVCELVKNMVSIQISSALKNIMKTKNNETKYFEEMMNKLFPKNIYKLNLDYFIKYNFVNVLPDYGYIIQKNTVLITNKHQTCIFRANIVM